MRKNVLTILCIALAGAAGCGRDYPTVAERPINHSQSPATQYGAVIPVSNNIELQNAVANSDNAGATIVLTTGTYTLDPALANSGRLELQPGMSMIGVVGNASAVIIDASRLVAANYTRPDGQQTGAIRVGRGDNTISWLTVTNAAAGVAAVEADLSYSGPSRVKISNTRIHGNRRAIDLRNFGATAAGRVLVAEITDNEIFNNMPATGQAQGIRIVNQLGAHNAVISVTMARNNIHHNQFGCLAANNNVRFATVSVSSDRDQFVNNGVGCGISGGIATDTVLTNNNTTSFTSRNASFSNSTGLVPAGIPTAGIVVEGGARAATGTASHNTVSVVLQSSAISNPLLAFDVRAWGARSTVGQVAGTNNTASVMIGGAPFARVAHVASDPPPAGTNVVTVVKY